ncbi:MAG: zeta toxin family protein [Eubacteriales bacterium]|nr:zeta toxin family protein [Eubacteriales bacterium]
MGVVPCCRNLNTDRAVEHFVDNILQITDKKEKRTAINRIAAAERNMKDYSQVPTLTHGDNRDYEYRDDKIREDLRKRIVEELKRKKRLKSDDEIRLGRGGAKPKTLLKNEKKAFFLIGPPASGKSTIASDLADYAGAYILDSDYAKRKLPEYDNQIGAASLVHEESDALVFSYNLKGKGNLLAFCVDNGYNMVIPKIGHRRDSILKLSSKLKQFGYFTFLISIDLDRVKATQRAYNRFIKSGRYVPLSLVFDYYANEPTLNYFKIRQLFASSFDGYAQVTTDVPFGQKAELLEAFNVPEIQKILGGIDE